MNQFTQDQGLTQTNTRLHKCNKTLIIHLFQIATRFRTKTIRMSKNHTSNLVGHNNSNHLTSILTQHSRSHLLVIIINSSSKTGTKMITKEMALFKQICIMLGKSEAKISYGGLNSNCIMIIPKIRAIIIKTNIPSHRLLSILNHRQYKIIHNRHLHNTLSQSHNTHNLLCLKQTTNGLNLCLSHNHRCTHHRCNQ